MYKSTSQSQQHLTRTGSASLTISRAGRVGHLPPDIRAEEAVYQSLKDQWSSNLAALNRVIAEREAIQKRLTGVPPEERTLLRREIKALTKQEQVLASHQGVMRKFIRDAGETVYATLYFRIAQLVLSKEIHSRIDDEVRELLGRSAHEVGSRRGKLHADRGKPDPAVS